MLRAAPAALALVASAAALAGCAAAQPSAAREEERLVLLVDGPPNAVLTHLLLTALAEGGAVVAESADGFSVDFGVESREVLVIAGPAAPGVPRETEVHEAATYGVRAAPGGGSLVSITHTPTWWNPERRCWLPGPFDAAPAASPRPGTAGSR